MTIAAAAVQRLSTDRLEDRDGGNKKKAPEKWIRAYGPHPFGAHCVRLSERYAFLGANSELLENAYSTVSN